MEHASKIMLVNPKDEIFLYLRDNIPTISHPNYWDLVGGGIKKGESPLQAIYRETMEEIGIVPKEVDFLGALYVKKSSLVIEDGKIFVFKGLINIPLEEITLNEGQKPGFFKIEYLSKIRFPKPYKDFFNKNKIYNID